MSDEVIEGYVVFGDDVLPFAGASIEVVLEDTTQADAPASPVRRVVLHPVAHDGVVGNAIGFSLRRGPVPPGHRQSLRVLVDLDGDGRLGPGDFRNAESVPIPPGSIRDVIVRVRRAR